MMGLKERQFTPLERARPFHSPGRFYPYSFLIQTYSKSALAPGQRLGYVALPPTMPDRERIRRALLAVAFGHGDLPPDAVMQYALPEIEALSIEIGEALSPPAGINRGGHRSTWNGDRTQHWPAVAVLLVEATGATRAKGRSEVSRRPSRYVSTSPD